jgi:hypothetical protein
MYANSHERDARFTKLAKLIDAADHEARRGGLEPLFHAPAIVEAWRKAKPEHFAQLCVLAAVRPASPVTIGLFLDALQHRAEARGAA